MDLKEAVDLVSKVIEVAGVLVIVIGIVWASVQYVRGFRSDSTPSAYTLYRRSLARAILLGLEFLVASDIIRTVASEFTFQSVGVLALIILMRTFLSIEMEMEIEGRFPWQRNRSRPADEAPPTSGR